MNEDGDSIINQISVSCVEWWSSFVCSLWFDLFHKVFLSLHTLSKNAWMRPSRVPSIRSCRVESTGCPLLPVVYDFICFMRFVQRYKRCLGNAWMRLSIVLSIRSRRAVSDGGPLLFVAYDLTCFIRFFQRYKRCLENAWIRLSIVPSIRSRRAVSEWSSFVCSLWFDLFHKVFSN